MRVHDDYAQGWNVEQQTQDPSSVWSFWKQMLAARKEYEALIYGKFIPLDESNEKVYAWIRDDPTINQKVLVVLNFARGEGKRGEEVEWTVPADVDTSNAKLIISNGDASPLTETVKLGPWEGRIYAL
jgi:alpha-glucosidase